jgi:CofH subfamily radical SAM domain protein
MARTESHKTGELALQNALDDHRLSRDEILALYHMPSKEVQTVANEVRLRKVDPSISTFSIGGNIDHTNVCNVGCSFCTFYRAPLHREAYTMSVDDIINQLHAQVHAADITDIQVMGGVNPELSFSWFIDVLKAIKSAYPNMHIDFLSPEEVYGLEKQTGRDAMDLLTDLKAAGMDGLPGASAEILVDNVRHATAPLRISSADWYRIVDNAMQLEILIPWTGQVSGLGERIEDRVDHLIELRDFQERHLEHGRPGLGAYKIWPMRLNDTRLRDVIPIPSDGEIIEEYVHQVAIHRLAVDNIVNHRAIWRTMGFQTATRALRAGANDLCGTGSINAVDSVLETHDKEAPRPSEKVKHGVLKCIADAGFQPAQRDPFYKVFHVYNSDEVSNAYTSLEATPGEWMRGGFTSGADSAAAA